MRTTLFLGVVLIAVSMARGDPVGSIERVRSLKSLQRLAARLEPRVRDGYEDSRIVLALAEAYLRFDRREEALALLARAERTFSAVHVDAFRKRRAEILEESGRLDEAIALANRRLKAAEDDAARFHIHRQLGRLFDKKLDWKTALRHYETPLPRTKCGTCENALSTIREMAIARCRFRLGEVDGALAVLESLIRLADASDAPPSYAVTAFCEYAARSGRSARARKTIDALPAQHRPEPLRILAMAEAFAAKEPAKLLGLAEEIHERGRAPLDWLAGLLVELGDPGAAALRDRILAGSRVAQLLARLTGRRDLAPALRRRLFAAEDPQERKILESVIEDLESTD